MSIWTKDFWAATTERAVKTAAQAGLLYVGADQFNVLAFDWVSFAGFLGGGAVLSVLSSLAGNAATKTGPSFTQAEVTPDSPAVEARGHY